MDEVERRVRVLAGPGPRGDCVPHHEENLRAACLREPAAPEFLLKVTRSSSSHPLTMKTLPDGLPHSSLALVPAVKHLVVGQPDHPVATELKIRIALAISIEPVPASLMMLERIELNDERVPDQEVNAPNGIDVHLLPKTDTQAFHAKGERRFRSRL
ncbi:MAG: hypothetical protein E6Z13_03950 [Dermabacter sp.]|nr:hypothetical protein [Dermabacter sp.]